MKAALGDYNERQARTAQGRLRLVSLRYAFDTLEDAQDAAMPRRCLTSASEADL
ncbi:MAG: hypothetical protein IPJ18_20240 [Betaproteobacteria bacterium]|nr:hypothetical protein [Betaproteobacteria bacterium]